MPSNAPRVRVSQETLDSIHLLSEIRGKDEAPRAIVELAILYLEAITKKELEDNLKANMANILSKPSKPEPIPDSTIQTVQNHIETTSK